jgi:hypothetical protein
VLQISQKKKLPVTASSRASKVSAVGCDILRLSVRVVIEAGQFAIMFWLVHFISFSTSLFGLQDTVLLGIILMMGLD